MFLEITLYVWTGPNLKTLQTLHYFVTTLQLAEIKANLMSVGVDYMPQTTFRCYTLSSCGKNEWKPMDAWSG